MSTQGSISREANGTWGFIVDMPAANGRRRQLRRRGFATKKAAQAALSEVLTDVQRGSFVRPTRLTVGEYLLERWLPARRADLRPSTLLGYEKVIRRRIVPLLGATPLSSLDPARLEAFYGELLTKGGRGGKPLSAKTVTNTAGLLSSALGDAVRLRLVAHNVASDARLPRRPHREMSAWSEAEAAAFLDAVRPDRMYPLWRLALATGLRRGELCGLRWKDVDLAAGAITIANTRVVAASVVDGAPKTKAGARIVALDAETTAVLAAWRRSVAQERLVAGSRWSDTGLVFVDEFGVGPHPETITRWWREATLKAGLPPIRLHDARHTAATVMLRAGVPVKVVSQRLGHADVAVTMRVYQHVTAQDDRLAADVLGRALGGGA